MLRCSLLILLAFGCSKPAPSDAEGRKKFAHEVEGDGVYIIPEEAGLTFATIPVIQARYLFSGGVLEDLHLLAEPDGEHVAKTALTERYGPGEPDLSTGRPAIVWKSSLSRMRFAWRDDRTTLSIMDMEMFRKRSDQSDAKRTELEDRAAKDL